VCVNELLNRERQDSFKCRSHLCDLFNPKHVGERMIKFSKEEVASIAKLYQVSVPQAKSILWSDFFEQKLAEIEVRFQGNFNPGWRFDCYCFDCKKGNVFLAPSSIREFILKHANHKTKTMKL